MVHLISGEIHTQLRISLRESRLPHVLQQFVGTNFLTEGILSNIYALNTLKIPDQMHHCTQT